MFAMVAAAYETLMDQRCRSRCDTLLRETNTTVSSATIPAGQIMVGNTRSLLQSSPRLRRQRVESNETLDSIIRDTPSIFDSIDEEEYGHRNNATPSLAEISLTDCSSDEEDSDDTEQHKNPVIISQSEEAAFTLLGSSSHPSFLDMESPKKQPRTRKPRTCKSFILDCAAGGSSYDESLQLPALLNSSSTTEVYQGDEERHYTETDTDRLFGGPLQLLFRARRWRPFTDPFVVYKSVFGSEIPGSSKADDIDDDKPTSWNSLDGTSSQGEPWKRGSAERQADGSMVYTQRRVFRNKRIIRRETVWTDLETGQKRTTVSVTSEPVENTLALQQTGECEQEQICRGLLCLSWTDIIPSMCTGESASFETMLCGASIFM